MTEPPKARPRVQAVATREDDLYGEHWTVSVPGAGISARVRPGAWTSREGHVRTTYRICDDGDREVDTGPTFEDAIAAWAYRLGYRVTSVEAIDYEGGTRP